MKIYTKTGDNGQTGLLGGVRVSKSHLAVCVCGSLDETNSLLGLALSQGLPADMNWRVLQIQNDLFDLGSRVADCLARSPRTTEFSGQRAKELEHWIDQIQLQLPELTQFILPGGSLSGASLHHCRTVCRRAERELVALAEVLAGTAKTDVLPFSVELVYLNRLSDLLFVMARFVNQSEGQTETTWRVTRG